MYGADLIFEETAVKCLFGKLGQQRIRKINVSIGGVFLEYDDMTRPETHQTPLYNSIASFLKMISGEIVPYMGLELPLNVLNILDICQKQMTYV